MEGNNIIYVIGHKNPDSDSICAAIGLAELKKEEGITNIEPARAGDINHQTAFILDYFNVKPPKFLPDVYPRARDIMTRNVITVGKETPLLKVMKIIREKNIRFIPVLDHARRVIGTITLMDIAKVQMEHIETEKARIIHTSVKNIAETLTGEIVTNYVGNEELDLAVYVAAMTEDSFLKVLGDRNPGECAVITGDREGIQRLSVERGIGLLIVTGGLKIKTTIIEAAREKGVSIIISPYDTSTTALRVRLSIPAYRVCNRDFDRVSSDDLAEDLKQRVTRSRDRGLVVLNNDGVIEGVITKSNLLRPSGVSLILVDHNEPSQAVDGAAKVRIIEIVDHHRLGNFHTSYPITFICEPVGSTSTLVAEFFRGKGINIKREIAGLLLGAILSDTVILRSPTTTQRDKEIVPWLAEKAGLEYEKFGKEIFYATSSIKKVGIEKAVRGDYKIFDVKGRKFGIGQVETVGFEEFFEVKEELERELTMIKEEKGLELSTLLITDIVQGTSLLLAVGEKGVISNLDYPRVNDNVYELRNVISRKKQVAPHLIALFNEISNLQ